MFKEGSEGPITAFRMNGSIPENELSGARFAFCAWLTLACRKCCGMPRKSGLVKLHCGIGAIPTGRNGPGATAHLVSNLIRLVHFERWCIVVC